MLGAEAVVDFGEKGAVFEGWICGLDGAFEILVGFEDGGAVFERVVLWQGLEGCGCQDRGGDAGFPVYECAVHVEG